MYLLRNATLNDLEDLYELSSKVTFINLPHNKKLIEQKIVKSEKSFKSPSKDLSENYYIFVLEDYKSKKVVGVSMIHAQHGTEDEPHFFLRVSQERKYSETINTGFTHGKLKLGLDTDGPTEIGGLVIHPEYRGTGEKLGKQISFVRFLYMAIHPKRFKKEIHSELMPPFDQEGKAPLWEAIGRKFMSMEYDEADILSRNNKEFILNLFPSENIYMTLLPMEARNAVGKVGNDTLPVKAMLEKVGFKYINEVDPFDGGPHYRCDLKEIKPIKNRVLKETKFSDKLENARPYLLELKSNEYDFAAQLVEGVDREDALYLTPDYKNELTSNSKGRLHAIEL
ncbi:MAG: arginine N-succinyltransferase [Halobacteriovoraceae bacterium]|nr:arginine N-succinyltransferase [Halobacteriovoraceae bacterium]|tara:strand:+ start:30560 stop:31576 length:1017 start_codon:yes stop_codon:yes gene_type:complete